ncbi:hypothetical protein [Paenibacillus sp. GM2]|uniref:hypothetical protein n=1 Tax=Paenibacillus sp. GM2 TaxID=1622070 RepID=UPI00083993D4|nr:hypothetical protein [Paenibacillus sp. GM2]
MSKNFKNIAGYTLLSALLSVLFVIIILRLWNADMSVPLSYSGDSLLTGLMIKSIIDSGWYLTNNLVGAPFGLEFFDFTMFDNFFLLIIKVFSLFTSQYALVYNVYFLLTFPLTAAVSFYIFRKLKLSTSISMLGSQLFTFVPYHFLRGQSHLFLSSYFFVPIIVFIIYKIYNSEINFYRINKGKIKLNLSKSNILLVLFCLVFSSCGIYYTFFSCFLLIIAGTSSWINNKKIHNLVNAILIIAILVCGSLLNIAPNLAYKVINGSNSAVADRSFVESEIYGLKISQLVLPVTSHRISYLAQLKEAYNSNAPLVNENDFSSLGIVGAIGLLISLIMLFIRKRFDSSKILSFSGEMNLAALLLATVGGFGTVFAMTILSEIRAYNRISIFISFFSITAFLVILNFIFEKIRTKTNLYKNLMRIFVMFVMFVGILDQTTNSMVPDYATTKQRFYNDKTFIGKIEKSLPSGSQIFQLPYVPFPENPPVNNMSDYELFKGYLHSGKLRWSYGVVKGREGDLFLKQLSEKPVDIMVNELSISGFNGIYIDTYGYSDGAKELTEQLTKVLNIKPLISSDERLLFYDLQKYKENLKSNYSDKGWEEKKLETLYPVLIRWSRGVYDLEGDDNHNWRWASKEGELTLYNLSNKDRTVTLNMQLSTNYPELSNITFESNEFSEEMQINNEPKSYTINITIPKGSYNIRFKNDVQKVYATDDSRDLYYRIENFSCSYE